MFREFISKPLEHGPNSIAKTLSWVEKKNVFISGQLGIAKPSIEIFRVVEKEMGITQEFLLHWRLVWK